MKFVVNNKVPRVLGTCVGAKLLPGKNDLDLPPEKVSAITRNEQFKSWQKLGWVAIIQTNNVDVLDALPVVKHEPVVEPVVEPAVPDIPHMLDEFKLPEALDFVVECTDVSVLERWYDDPRKTIKQAIEKRVEVLEGPLQPKPAEEPKEEALPGIDEIFGDL